MIFIFMMVSAAVLHSAHFQDQDQDQDQCPGGSCNPQLGDLMLGRGSRLSATSTCGLNGPQNYCIIGYLQEEQKCFTCDSRDPFSAARPDSHRIENVIATFDPDRSSRWWQSENGVHQVSIQLDLETMFQFSHLVLTFKSFRPAAMLVERSRDFGRTWKVFRYFAEDCSLHFPSVSSEPADSVDDVVCDGRYSGPEPSTGGEVVLKALDPVFQIQDPYAQNIQDLITLTNIRVNFTRLFTLGDILLSRRRRQNQNQNRNPQDKYYYSLYSMVVRGSCFCNGHAGRCGPVDGGRGDVFTQPGMVHGRCVCRHNTAGENCERCENFHHDSPWRPGGGNAADVCRRCNCHGHSDSCHFDATRYEATGGASGGVCDDCRHDRAGPQCERCRDFLYRDPARAPHDPDACIPCDCDPRGSVSAGLCDALSGTCVCKENVGGAKCERCKPGFYGLREDDPAGCQECRCHPLGSAGSCDDQTGACRCEGWASGALCDQCVAGFWGLGSSGSRCSPCDCDIGGALGTSCSPDGQCNCLPNMIGRRCSDPAPGHFLPSLDYFLYEAELAAPVPGGSPAPLTPPPSSSLLNPGVLPQCEKYFREQGYDFRLSGGRVVLVRREHHGVRRRRQDQRGGIPLEPGQALQLIPRQAAPDQLTTWTGLGLVRVLEGAGLRFTVDNVPSSKEYRVVIRYEPESPTDWLASLSVATVSPGDGGCGGQSAGSQTVTLPGNSRGVVLEVPVCLNTGGRYYLDLVFTKAPGSDGSHILIDSMSLIPSAASVQDFCSQADPDASRRSRCVGLAAEAPPDVCEGLVKSLSARVHNGAIPCRCNVIGSLGPSCSKVGGVCECKANVIGRCCDACAPLTFDFGPDGCKPCDCDPRGSASPLCQQDGGHCACRPEATGRRCDRCQRGLWDFPQCRPCECNGRSEECDGESGECAACRDHTAGARCDRCADGYHGDPVSGQPCQPCLCPGVQGGERFFATSCRYDAQSLGVSCACLEGHAGSRCDRCAPGFYGDLSAPGTRCQECPCNNNIDPDDGTACDPATGRCLRCLHNTTGPRCQDCKAGYYGNAAEQDCKECSCDRRGTQVTQCPLGSPCFCDPRTGRCPCRTGAEGDLCDQCQDGFWNLDGASGCQPCSCDPANSASNVCDKVTGQCPCQPEFGGQQCDECGENHFGNPDLQCISCDCNLEGTERPACDAGTGECLCRRGVTGIFCDECAPGFDSAFPACAECHPCTALWTESVTDVKRAAQQMRSLVPQRGADPPAAERRQLQRLDEMQWKLEILTNLSGQCSPTVEELEELHLKIRKVKDAIDLNVIQIDPTRLLNTEMDNIQLELQKLLDRLKNGVPQESNRNDSERQEELQQEIQKLHRSFMADEKKVRKANQAVENSMDTRQEVKRRLGLGSRGGDLAPLEKKIQDLSVVPFNQKVCGEPGLDDCSGCGGALCGAGRRKCGGPDCDGAVPVSQRALESAETARGQLTKLPSRLQESKDKVLEAQQAAQDTKDQAQVLQDRIQHNADNFEREKNKTRELIQKVKLYLTDDMVPPDDIEKISRAVLNIQLPGSPDQVQNLIRQIQDLLRISTGPQPDPQDLEDRSREAQELLEEARKLRERAAKIDTTEILQDVYQAGEAQDLANDKLDAASRDRDRARDQVQEIEDKLDSVESKLKNLDPDLLDDVRALKEKTDLNRNAATNARTAAEFASASATEARLELTEVTKQYEDLKQKRQKQDGDHEAAERVKNIMKEAEDMKTDVESKLRHLEDLQTKILALVQRKIQREVEVSDLLKEADFLRRNITKRAEELSECRS
ncbi:unnamed protein product [Ophioblennius macclurei]